jgi:hypothetical protein
LAGAANHLALLHRHRDIALLFVAAVLRAFLHTNRRLGKRAGEDTRTSRLHIAPNLDIDIVGDGHRQRIVTLGIGFGLGDRHHTRIHGLNQAIDQDVDLVSRGKGERIRIFAQPVSTAKPVLMAELSEVDHPRIADRTGHDTQRLADLSVSARRRDANHAVVASEDLAVGRDQTSLASATAAAAALCRRRCRRSGSQAVDQVLLRRLLDRPQPLPKSWR